MTNNLREIRKILGITQLQLANMIDVDRTTISKLETNGSCSIGTAVKIANALRVTLDELFETSAAQDSA